MIRFAPEGVVRPRWLVDFLRHGGLPDLTCPNLGPAVGQRAPTFFGAYYEWMTTTLPTWDDVAWLREPVGRAVRDQGRAAPGRRQAGDRRRAPARSRSPTTAATTWTAPRAPCGPCPGMVDAVGGQLEVLLDGGIRRGSDVVKALALGARAVMIGRAYLWGLAANGEAGGQERAGHPAQRRRRGAARPGPGLGARPGAGGPDRARRTSPACRSSRSPARRVGSEMSDVLSEARRRRTFAVISHPDAGKSTLTEALALLRRA